MQIFLFFWIIMAVAVCINAIVIMIQGEVELKSRLLWVTYRRRFLRGKPAYVYAIANLIGSLIMLIALALYPIFGIDTGYFGVLLCGTGVFVIVIVSALTLKHQTVD